MRWRWIGIAGSYLLVIAFSLALFFAFDFFFGAQLLRRVAPEGALLVDKRFIESQYRIVHPVYHHVLAPGYKGLGVWGSTVYKVCTNEAGFKVSCEKSEPARKEYDIAFAGDSFTEGIGLTYEQSFVGRIAAARPDLKIINLGVASYAPSIYLTRIKGLIEEGYKFKEVVVYVDLCDVNDEANYKIVDGRVTGGYQRTDAFDGLEYRLRRSFPLTNYNYALIMSHFKKHRDKTEEGKDAWTYDPNAPGFGTMGIQGAIEKSVALMTELYELLQKNGVQLSVGVYPWPAQVRHDVEDSLQVKIWRDFCEKRCKHFYNSFPAFFAKAESYGKEEAIKRLFIKNDVHFNEAGAELIARDFLNIWKSDSPVSVSTREGSGIAEAVH